jgi:hypothetical protein
VADDWVEDGVDDFVGGENLGGTLDAAPELVAVEEFANVECGRDWRPAEVVQEGLILLVGDAWASGEDIAGAIREGADASLPNGSQYVANPVPRDTSVFAARLDWLQRKLILAGTGGLLTSLAMPQGIGSGAAQEHADVFAQLAAGDARDISGLFQRQIDARILARHFPGRPALAYFQLAAAEADDTAAYIDSIAKLSAAGYTVDPAEISERLGWGVTRQEPPAAPPFPNRAYVRDKAGMFDEVPGGSGGNKPPKKTGSRRYLQAIQTGPHSEGRRAFSGRQPVQMDGKPSEYRWGGDHVSKDHPERLKYFRAAKAAVDRPDKVTVSPKDPDVLIRAKRFERNGNEGAVVVFLSKRKKQAFDYIPMKVDRAKRKGYLE